ncbi:MAG TPA: hypothetical protein VI731_06380 [Bacteroidia bacterium]|nr:hypothetical protein [Bacteroidia bacterium]
MKKLFVILALAGMTGSVSATTLASFTGNAVVVFTGDKKGDKKKKKKKAGCETEQKGCAKDGEKKSGCCKGKTATPAPAPAPAQ